MQFLGLSLGQVLALMGAAGAGVVVLYLLKLRRRVVVVPFVKMWDALLSERQTTRLSNVLKRFWSLLFSLLMVASLAFALGDPRPETARTSGRTLVLLIDTSISMQATDVAPSRLEVAKEKARATVRGLGPGDRALVAAVQTNTIALSPFSDEPAVLLDAIDRAQPVDVAADLTAALRFSRNVLRDQPSPEIVLYSDGRFPVVRDTDLEHPPIRFSFEPVGSTGRNIGITAFSVRRYPLDKSRVEILVDVKSASRKEERVDVTLIADGTPIEIKRLVLPPGGRRAEFFESVPGVNKTLEARLSFADGTQDDLPADDRAYACLPPRRRARVLSVSEGNLYLNAALLLDEYLDVTEATPTTYARAVRSGGFDVVIFDAWVPPSLPSAHTFWIAPAPRPDGVAPFEVSGVLPRPFFERIDRRHPVVKWTALENVNVAEALLVRPEPRDHIVAGDARGPLIVSGTRGDKKMVALTFDIRKSDLPLRVAWPLVLLNAIDWFADEDARYIPTFVAGETSRVPLPIASRDAAIEEPDGTTHAVPIAEGRAVFSATRAGFHTLRAGGTETVFAVNVRAEDEVDIAASPTDPVGGLRTQKPSKGRVGIRQELWIYFVGAVFLALAVEWWTFHRRWTV